ncbi:TIGR02611 family protein [Streptoalloteichus hindustanus]|uniref:TIGR02611 family protein n=1 Tax=Streptoalloteichus hindustanus TaxID=2017 RepID=A0A1M5H8X8_STRHI|nr:TIGR02611 family protein [Streptoalloteichus hindustanus]SHG12385.1 TIGR02611 family protein [Streptoalloteichus hindustanus]
MPERQDQQPGDRRHSPPPTRLPPGARRGGNGEPDDVLEEVAEQLGFRDRLRRNPALRLAYRAGVGVAGGLVLAVGVVAIPYPGPGWLIVFAGLAILATEFRWAARVLGRARSRYDAWTGWLRRQRLATRLLVAGATGVVVLGTLWLLNVFGLVAGLLRLDLPWLGTPISSLRGWSCMFLLPAGNGGRGSALIPVGTTEHSGD